MNDPGQEQQWKELTEPKQWSRLLYPNPVCFLCTSRIFSQIQPVRNVMVLSWLTATNNSGQVLFSLNQRRHTASVLKPSSYFVLCVPVEGMQDLVRQVGGTSGRWGRSKFPQDYNESSIHEDSGIPSPLTKHSKNQKPRFPRGILGLSTIPVGGNARSTSSATTNTAASSSVLSCEEDIFAIDGSVAHLVCRLDQLNADLLLTQCDDSHLLGVAQVVQAFVRSDYWNDQNNTFAPSRQLPRYLTFLGSQTFGAVQVIGG